MKETKKPITDVQKTYDESGTLNTEVTYKDGKQHGVQKRYYKSGALITHVHIHKYRWVYIIIISIALLMIIF